MTLTPLTQTTAAAHCPTLTGRTDKAVAGGRRNTAFTPPTYKFLHIFTRSRHRRMAVPAHICCGMPCSTPK